MPEKMTHPGNLFLVYGTDDLSALRKADEIVATLCPPEEQAFGLETLSPESGDKLADNVCSMLRNTIEALLTPPFLGGSKTVYLRGAPFFDPMTEPGRFESVKTEVARLTDLLKKGLPDGVSFVVLTPKVHKATAFFKTCKSQGETHGFDQPDKEKEAAKDFIPRVEALLAESGLTMSQTVFNAFLGRTGYSLRQVSSEIEKLSLYLGDRNDITLADIQLMVATVRENKFYEFADTFCKGNLADTLHVMHLMFAQGQSPVGLVVNLQNRLRDMLVMRDCLDRRWAVLSQRGKWSNLNWQVPAEGEALLGSLEKDPRKGNPFAAGMMAAQASRFPAGLWFRWLNAAVDAQASMTGGEAIDPKIALELFATRALGAVQNSA
jgi:DNA polymerase III subunit delta